MAQTLVEAAKLETDEIRAAVIEVYAMESDLLRVLPIETIQGSAIRFNREGTMPGAAFRGVNEGYVESTGQLDPTTEPLLIAGGDVDVDTFIVRTMGERQRGVQEALKIKSLAHTTSHKFIKGDASTDAREPDGLQKRAVGDQLLAAGSASGGDALSLLKLDELIDKVDGATHLLMTKAMRRLLTQAARDTDVGGFIVWQLDEFGRQMATYNTLPILIADANMDLFASLGFDEANPGGGSNVGTSIYALSLNEGGLTGIQSAPLAVRDLGELDTKPVLRTRIEWDIGLAQWGKRSIARLHGIKNSAVLA